LGTKCVTSGHPNRLSDRYKGGELGKVYAAKTGWYRRKEIPGWGTWFTDRSQSGGGPLIDIGVHMLDVALYLMGNPKPVSVTGATYAEFGQQRKGIGTWGKPNWNGKFDVEDLAMAYIKMEDGSSLLLEVSWAVNMDTENAPFLHLMGTEGGVSLKGEKGGFKSGKFLTEKFDRPMEIAFEEPADDVGGRYRLTQHFLECVREGKEPITSVITGYTNNLILEAIYQSSKTGNEVKLDWSI
jgi:predicted dehydrogenase